MSKGYGTYGERSKKDLAQILSQGDTENLQAKPVRIDTTCDVPDTGGISVDAKTVYIDRTFAQWLKSGKVIVRGMTADNIIAAIVEHEKTEKVVSDGDNAADTYPPCHEFALRGEHNFVEKLISSTDRYEDALAPAIKKIGKRRIENPPKDLWCGPYLDDPDENDKRIISEFRRCGVRDAFKASKRESVYGMGADQCKNCVNFCDGRGPLRECRKVSGLVRDSRWCTMFEKRKDAD